MKESPTQSLKAEAKRLGFQLSAACPAVDARGYSQFLEWLKSGYAGEMEYLERRKSAYKHPKHVLEGCKSILVLGTSYHNDATPSLPTVSKSAAGRIAKYTMGPTDYHDVIHARLKKLKRFSLQAFPESNARGVIDTAPLLEREFAQLAGLGWIGKNTLLLNRSFGSWFFLAGLLIDIEMDYDEPFAQDHCGTCTACLDACPTDAFVDAGVLDARKCISYLTIEHRSPIDSELRPLMGDWLFGCDVCQDVCPWNHKAQTTEDYAFQPTDKYDQIDLIGLFDLDDDQFRARFRKTPFWRPRRRGILRNAAIVLGNQKPPDGILALEKGLNDVEPLVRGASAWALSQYETKQTASLLAKRLEIESNPIVRTEIESISP